jgi:hypothetical protein
LVGIESEMRSLLPGDNISPNNLTMPYQIVCIGEAV